MEICRIPHCMIPKPVKESAIFCTWSRFNWKVELNFLGRGHAPPATKHIKCKHVSHVLSSLCVSLFLTQFFVFSAFLPSSLLSCLLLFLLPSSLLHVLVSVSCLLIYLLPSSLLPAFFSAFCLLLCFLPSSLLPAFFSASCFLLFLLPSSMLHAFFSVSCLLICFLPSSRLTAFFSASCFLLFLLHSFLLSDLFSYFCIHLRSYLFLCFLSSSLLTAFFLSPSGCSNLWSFYCYHKLSSSLNFETLSTFLYLYFAIIVLNLRWDEFFELLKTLGLAKNLKITNKPEVISKL